MQRRTFASAIALGLAGLAAAVIPAGAGPVAESTVAVITDPSVVDTGPIVDGGEVLNLIEDLEAGGHTVVEIPDIDAEGAFAGLTSVDVLAVPELENLSSDSLVDEMPASAADAIRAFVDGGGRILFFGDSDPTPTMNDLFSYALVESDDVCEDATCPLTPAGASTEFADGPAELVYVNGSTGVESGSLPAVATEVYREGDTNVAVASMPYGDGAVVFFAWDWYPETQQSEDDDEVLAADAGDEADWATVLDLGVSQPAVTAELVDGQIVFTSDSPSTQPVFVSLTIDGAAQTVAIEPLTTTASVAAGDGVAAAFTVPGWGVGEGQLVLSTVVAPPAPVPGGPAVPAPANPSFTG